MLKLSKYSELINSKNEVIIFNTYNGSRSRLFDKKFIEIAQRLKKGEILSDNEVDSNFAKLYCVDSNVNEVEKIIEKYYKVVKDRTTLSIIVYPTMECNFKCVYCYENSKKTKLSEDNYDNLYKSILKYCIDNNTKAVRIDWFGGEPLLCWKEIVKFSNKLNIFFKEHNIDYKYCATTNGYLLTPTIVKKIFSVGLTNFQITVDGDEESHNKLRILKNGGPTWNKIIDNIQYISNNYDDFYILLRVNYNISVINRIDSLINKISSIISGNKNINLIFKPIGKWGGYNDQNIDTIPLEFTGFTRLSLIKKMLSTNVQVSNDINFEFLSEICYANYENKFTIYSDGNIGKCTLKDTENCGCGYVVGNIRKGFFDVDYEVLSKWSSLNIQEMDKKGCFDCICFPFCLSTCCPLSKIEGKGTSRCTESKSILKDLILEEYEQKYKK
mgnify:CR=1 FL=1